MIDRTDLGAVAAGTDEPLYYLRDGLGSTAALTSADGTVVERYTYDGYGTTYVETPGGGARSFSAYGNPFLWTGQRYDAGVGQYHFHARTLWPAWGRWLQRDPLGYVGGMPLVFVDPLGLESDAPPWWAVLTPGGRLRLAGAAAKQAVEWATGVPYEVALEETKQALAASTPVVQLAERGYLGEWAQGHARDIALGAADWEYNMAVGAVEMAADPQGAAVATGEAAAQRFKTTYDQTVAAGEPAAAGVFLGTTDVVNDLFGPAQLWNAFAGETREGDQLGTREITSEGLTGGTKAVGTAATIAGGVEAMMGGKGTPCPPESSAVQAAGDAATSFLGPNARVITNKAGDLVFLSENGLRRIRFDFNRPYPHASPHVHADVKVGGTWQESGPIYPTDVPPY